jgi:succinylarginine dihydrolase
MANGGGPACLRLRIPLAYDEYQALDPRIFMDDNLYNKLYEIINNFYTDKLTLENLLDKNFLEQSRRALDNISQVLGLPKIYSWQI